MVFDINRPQVIESARFYDIAFVSGLLGLSTSTAYKSICGFNKFPLPRVTRLGRKVRFLGKDILEFCRQSESAGPDASDVRQPSVLVKRRPGRPKNAERDRLLGYGGAKS
jgi:predicted DNA-binding transcriptional regulator AlpA